jgi:hypothetical protein
MKTKADLLKLLEEIISVLENPKGSILSAIQKLSRVAFLIENDDLQKWCAIQLGDSNYTTVIKKLLEIHIENQNNPSKKNEKEKEDLKRQFKDLGLSFDYHLSQDEINAKVNESGGGYINIGFVEEKYADLVRKKVGNDNVYYKSNLLSHLNFVRNAAHQKASVIYNKLKYSETPKNSFDLLREKVDDKLLDIAPELAEQLMLAFKSVNSRKDEEWSQALTTCRRLIEGLADIVYPPTDKKNKDGRELGKNNYINRIWAYMDEAIDSDSNKQLAKSHIDYLGFWLEKINKLSNKGVHANLKQFEATKTVFHLYLVLADIIEYISKTQPRSQKININSASLDEIESLLGVKRDIAKEIIKLRVSEKIITIDNLSKLKGIGPKTLIKAQDEFDF